MFAAEESNSRLSKMRNAVIFITCLTASFAAQAENWLDAYFVSYSNVVQDVVIPSGTVTADIPNEWNRSGEGRIEHLTRSFAKGNGKLWCLDGRVILGEWNFSEGTCAVGTLDGFSKGMSFGSGFEWLIQTNGVLCLVQYQAFKAPAVERLIFMDMKDSERRFPCSFFSLEGYRVGMIEKEVETIKFISENKWTKGNAAKQIAGVLAPLLGVACELGDSIGRWRTKGLNIETREGFVVALSRHYTKDFMDQAGGYDALIKRLTEKLGKPTSTKKSRFYVHQKSTTWNLPQKDWRVAVEQEDDCTCTISVSSISKLGKRALTKTSKKSTADFGF